MNGLRATVHRVWRAGGVVLAEVTIWGEVVEHPPPEAASPPWNAQPAVRREVYYVGPVVCEDEAKVEEAVRVKAAALAAEALARAFSGGKIIEMSGL